MYANQPINDRDGFGQHMLSDAPNAHSLSAVFTPKDKSKWHSEWLNTKRDRSIFNSESNFPPDTFGFHFIPYEHYPYAHFYPNDEQFKAKASTEKTTPSPDPILYEYRKDQSGKTDDFDSGETTTSAYENYMKPNSPNSFDSVIVGVENLIFIGDVGSGQHLNVVIRKGSDGLEPEFIDESGINIDEYFPSNLEVRIFSESVPSNEDLKDVNAFVQQFVRDSNLNPYAD